MEMKLRAALALFENKIIANVPQSDQGPDRPDRLVGFRINDSDTTHLHEPIDGIEIILQAARMYLEENDEPSDE
jgi:hypothetical protein